MFYYSSSAFGPPQSPPPRDGGVSVLALPAYQNTASGGGRSFRPLRSAHASAKGDTLQLIM